MPKHTLPIPRLTKPYPKLDPHALREPYVTLLSEIHLAEKGALGMFETLGDPTVVQNAELFVKMRNKLVKEEREHMKDFEDIMRSLGADGVPPPNPASMKFQDAYRNWNGYVLPVKASVAALLFMFSEGNGYAVLHHLCEATTDPEIKAKLASNIKDEQSHLRMSMSILTSSLEIDGRRVLWTLLVQMIRFAAEARAAVDANRKTVEALGFDFYDMAGSSYRFLSEILRMSIEDAGMKLSPSQASYLDRFIDSTCTPDGMRAASRMYMPPAEWVRPAVRLWDTLERMFEPSRAQRDEVPHGRAS